MAATSGHHESTFAQKFMFVDLSITGTSPHHSEVLSHVRRNYHKRQRKEKIDRLRDISAVSSGPFADKIRLPSRRPQTTPLSERPTDDASSSGSVEGNGANSRRLAVSQGSCRHSVQPLLAHAGNSDPFCAYAIKIDPQINEVIAFYRDYTLPAQYHVPSRDWVSSASARLDWSICISTLQHPDLASAFVARAATIAAVIRPGLRSLAMRYRLRSIQQLRVKLLNNDRHGWSDLFLLQIIMLHKAEIVDKNLPAAATHAKVLQHLFQERQRMYGTIDYTLLQYALWSESQVCTIFMSPFTFDVEPDGWVAKAMQPIWASGLKELNSLPPWRALRAEAEEGLDKSVEGMDLRAFFVSRRTTLQTWLYFGLRGMPVSPLIMLWLSTTASVHQGRMIKHYLHAVCQVSEETCCHGEKSKRATSDVQCWYVQQYLILAEFIWTHHTSYKVEICGVDLFDVVPTLLRKLRAALEHDLDSSKYQNARVWALFVGAHTEWSIPKAKQPGSRAALSDEQNTRDENQKPEDYSKNDSRWFHCRLAIQIRQMGLTKWTEVRNIFQGFNHADVISPLGEKLINEVLGRY
ncbi:hypothetical protein G647_03650 [Cladophialophora carrionii CBS 160.54]|uniref:Transcription factor domain-containing protein n=1 Tax=Cladophialophora carrionii CBS 160.54 TaxID=1279043 RepID=V9DC48_9EURO|nr:uncharacterized protein G647_03650 [Cladophialophora carrionii CBS 160.54]ETI24281.1 hypothetical protein G647_03650 [Cladophialophora carrionii CBS 160.54]